MATQPNSLTGLFSFSLIQADFGRRARRLGLGTEFPSGILAFKSLSVHPVIQLGDSSEPAGDCIQSRR